MKTTRALRGISSETSLRLCSRAPRMRTEPLRLRDLMCAYCRPARPLSSSSARAGRNRSDSGEMPSHRGRFHNCQIPSADGLAIEIDDRRPPAVEGNQNSYARLAFADRSEVVSRGQ
jgi:hypothetical protein